MLTENKLVRRGEFANVFFIGKHLNGLRISFLRVMIGFRDFGTRRVDSAPLPPNCKCFTQHFNEKYFC